MKATITIYTYAIRWKHSCEWDIEHKLWKIDEPKDYYDYILQAVNEIEIDVPEINSETLNERLIEVVQEQKAVIKHNSNKKLDQLERRIQELRGAN